MLGRVPRVRLASSTPKPIAAALTTAAWLAATLGGSPQAPAVAAVRAPRPAATRPEIVTSAFALAQLTSYIGGKAIQVVNLAPPGVQPHGLHLTPAGRAAIGRSALVIDVGDGYQPQVEA